MSYAERVAENLLPKSVSKSLAEALREWKFTGHMIDHETDSEICYLCDKERLRYHFQIQNDQTQHALWIGSQCILKFEIPVFHQGRLVAQDQVQKHLAHLTYQMRQQSCIKALERLAAAEANGILSTALAHYKQEGVLTPKQAFVVFWRLHANKIDHSPSFFKICLRRLKHQDDLRDMEDSRVHMIWPALTPAQRQKALALGKTAPGDVIVSMPPCCSARSPQVSLSGRSNIRRVEAPQAYADGIYVWLGSSCEGGRMGIGVVLMDRSTRKIRELSLGLWVGTNNLAYVLAAQEALAAVPMDRPITVSTNSNTLIDWMQKQPDAEYGAHPEERTRLYRRLNQLKSVDLRHVSKNSGDSFEDRVCELALAGAIGREAIPPVRPWNPRE